VTGATVPPSGNDQTTTPTTGTTSTGGTTSVSAPAATVSHITKRMSIVHTRGGRARHVFETPAVQSVTLRGGRHLQSNNTGYSAQISKTTDGGNTWTSQYYSTGLFAMNGIGERRAAATRRSDARQRRTLTPCPRVPPPVRALPPQTAAMATTAALLRRLPAVRARAHTSCALLMA